MSSELERAYAALSRDAERATLAPAAELRRRATRQTAVRSATGLIAVAVLATGATVGTRFVLAGDERGMPLPPAASASATPAPALSPVPSTVPPSSAPPSPASASSRSSAGATIPRSIPARALLTEAEGNVGPAVRQDSPRRLRLCDRAEFASEDLVGVRASVLLLYRSPELDVSYTPEDSVHNTVTVYRAGGAAASMDELRAAVKACPEGGTAERPARFRSLGTLGRGDESLLVERSTEAFNDDGTPAEGRNITYLAAVRVGDATTLVETTGYESATMSRTDVESLVRAATDRLSDWRS